MKELTKKRTKAIVVDQLIYNAAIMGTEMAFRRNKSVKSEFIASVVVPTLVTWGAEYILLRQGRQTI